MSNTVLIVITRLTADRGGGLDEFVHDWNTPSDAPGREGVLFKVTDNVKLLLVHGHNKVESDLIHATIDAAVKEIKEKGQKEIEEINESKSDIRVFVHGSKEENYNFDGLFEGQDIKFSQYSSLQRGSIATGFLDALKENGIDDKIRDAIAEKCLNPARLQVLYLNQIRILLLALQLNVVVAKKNGIQDDLQLKAIEYTECILEEIKKCVQNPVIQKLKVPTRYQRIFLIWDIAAGDSQLDYFEDAEKVNSINWSYKNFWKGCSNGRSINKLLDTLDGHDHRFGHSNQTAHVERTEEMCHGKPVIRYFVSYAHDDDDLKEKLLKPLKQRLAIAKDYCFEAWDDGEILAGERWHEQIQVAVARCQFGLLLVSPAFLGSAYIKGHELPAFIASNLAAPEPERRVIPVALKRIPFDNSMDLKGLEHLQVFHDSAGRAFQERRNDNTRDDFASELFQQILKIVRRKTFEEGFKQDLRNITTEIKSLLTRVGVKGSDSYAGS